MKPRRKRPKLTPAEKRRLAEYWRRLARESEAALRRAEEERGYLWAKLPVDPRLDCTKNEPAF